MKKVLASIFISVAMAVSLVACSSPIGSSGTDLACANKVVQQLTTDKSVSGLWSCLTSKFQQTLTQYVSYGMLISADDAVFTDGKNSAPPVVTTSFLGQKNGVDVYAVVLKGSDGSLVTLTITVWVDSSGKVDNINISGPLF